jgi:hypothetical protein
MLRAVPWCQAILGLLLLALGFSSSPVPLARGTVWEYRELYTEPRGEVDSTTEDVTRFEMRGSATRPFLSQTGGVDPSSGPVEEGEGWIRLTPWTGEDALPIPLEVGQQGPRVEGGAAWSVEAQEEVTVPAGTFQALRCVLRGPGALSTLWIAPGVGVVKETQGSGAPGRRPEIERLLLKWKKPLG